MNQPLKYHGGKAYLAHKLIKLMPPHLTYCEPYAGGLAVLLAKPYEGISEIANDIDGKLMNFWTVLQHEHLFEKFKRVIDAVPFSEAAFNVSKSIFKDFGMFGDIPDEGRICRAVSFFITARQSLAGRMKDFASISKNRIRRGMNEQVSAWLTTIEGLPEVHNRLKRVLLLNRTATEVIKQFNEETTLHYLDPTYLHETRVSTKVYKYEMSQADHEDLLKTITRAETKSNIMISGYESQLYNDYLSSWHKEVFPVPNSSSHKKKKEIKNEVVWMNFDGKAHNSRECGETPI